jgi:hypothetical protein
MIIEDPQIECDVEEGNHLIVTGRSLESILARRIVWDTTVLTGNFQDGILKLLTENVITPTITDRAISNFIFEVSVDPIITALTIDAQIPRGTDLYETVRSLCSEKDIGFKITLSEAYNFILKLYAGADRSYDQIANPYVVFSPEFDNIINSNYMASTRSLKTVTLVDGEGEGASLKSTVVGSGIGLSRRELYTDARSMSQTVDSTTLTDEEYLAQLAQKGAEELKKYSGEESFDGQIDTFTLYKYGEDFSLGDIIQLVNEYGIESKSRITEAIISQNKAGTGVYPKFTTVE